MTAHGLERLMARVLWPTTTTMVWRASSKMMLATCGPRPHSTPGWTLLVSLGYMFVVRAHSTGGTWTLSTPNGCRRGTAELVDHTASPGRFLSTGIGRGWCSSWVQWTPMHSAHCAQDRGVPLVQFLVWC